jgi:glycosyltransferase involved in cell wall biosynthesis
MKIALLSKADASGGGASRVAEDLARLLNANGHTAHHYVAVKQPDNSSVRSLYGSFTWGRLLRRLHHLVKRAGFPELIPWELPPLYLQKIHHYDVLHFHDLSSAISPLTVRYLARRRPTVWTFHDCSPFTGGCLYPLDCLRYQTRCGPCPQLGQWPLDTQFDFTGFMQDIKRATAREERFTPVTPSAWLAGVAAQSGMFAAPPQVIPNAVDTALFCPLDKPSLRAKLGLPVNRPIILLIASYISEARKGLNYALQTLAQLKELNPFLLLVGHTDEQTRLALAGFDYRETGFLTDNQLKAQYFAAADIFLFSSVADNLPLVVLETMAAGVPTIGFATGGVPEMVEHRRSGYLVPPTDVPSLVDGLTLALTTGCAAEWGRAARRRAEAIYSYQIFLDNHLALYQQMIRDFKSS